ncbi:hypothetical protein ACFYW8_32100 [Streptomyces sp. NPDC002742]|uniref:hypothetical protein n=1 Tax=Streptomyces sp. NPDC002742 TaxID=3364663 RepID=UPI00367771BC
MAMNARRTRQLLEASAPLLLQDEQVELTSLASVGTVSVRKQALTAVIVGVLTLGMVMATVRPRAVYVVLTNQRILFFDGNRGGKPGKLLMNIARPYVTATAARKAFLGLKTVTHLTIEGQEGSLKVDFPVQTRADGHVFAGALPVTR